MRIKGTEHSVWLQGTAQWVIVMELKWTEW